MSSQLWLFAWQDKVKAQPGKNHGSPHIEVGLGCIHAIIEAMPDGDEQKKFTDWWQECIQGAKTQEAVAEEIQIFTARVPKKSS